MDWFSYFLIGSISLFVLSTIIIGLILVYKFRRKVNVHATIFLKNGGQHRFLFKRGNRVEKDVLGKAYVLNEKAVHKTAWYDYIYYLEDNSEPLIFNHASNKPEITSSELKVILDDDLIKKLFSDNEIKTLQLLVIIALVTGLISMIGVLYLIFGGVKVKDTPELRALVYNVTRSAIMGV